MSCLLTVTLVCFLFLCFLFFPHHRFPNAEQGIPHSVMPPLPKRPALEKTNGAAAMFNAGMLQYQQVLASMQFQQQAAFIPSGRALRHLWWDLSPPGPGSVFYSG